MEGSSARHRMRTRDSRRTADSYMVSLATVAAFCLTVAASAILTSPEWSTLLFDIPLGAWLLGWAGGLLTIISSPSWARRLGSRYQGRVVGLTCYRLTTAFMMGALGYSLATAVSESGGFVLPGWFILLAAFASGVLEKYVNEGVLRAFGFLAPREIDPRLL